MPDWDALEREYRARTRRPPAAGDGDWYRIEAKAEGEKKSAEIWIYDRIGRDWLDGGTDAKSFARKLRDLDVEEILLHLNTPGGDAFDGIAIYNSLKDHKADVTVVVDGLAASAGSFIAQAGDRVKMNRAAQMMIHDASGIVIGNAKDVGDFAAVLNKLSDSIASIYAGRAGGEVAGWREFMTAETWYTAAEAVEAGLADETVEGTPAEPKARASFDLRVFNYAGRDRAPAPVLTHRKEPTKEGAGMDPAKLREALGLAAGASVDEVNAALAANNLGVQPDPNPPDPGNPNPPEPRQPGDPEPEPGPQPPANAAGTMRIDVSAWQEREARIKRLEAADAKRRRDERDEVIAQACRDGKFSPERKDFWTAAWDKAPEETRALIDGLTKNVVPVNDVGYAASGDDDSIDAEFAHLFPPARSGQGG